MSPSWIEIFLAPELQIDDCFAAAVTRQTLKLQHYKRATRISAAKCAIGLRRFVPPRLARDLRSLHHGAPPYKNPGYAPDGDLHPLRGNSGLGIYDIF